MGYLDRSSHSTVNGKSVIGQYINGRLYLQNPTTMFIDYYFVKYFLAIIILMENLLNVPKHMYFKVFIPGDLGINPITFRG